MCFVKKKDIVQLFDRFAFLVVIVLCRIRFRMTCILAVGLTYTPALFTFPPWDLPGPRPPPITPHPSGRCPKIPQISKHGLGAKHRLPYLLRHRVEALMIHREIPGSRRSKMDLR